MNTTRASLLKRVKDQEDADAWREFVGLYRPLLVRYASARGLPADDAEDVAQHCLGAMTQKLADFEYDPGKGRFRAWLRRIVDNRVNSMFRRRRELPARTGDFDRPHERERPPDEAWEQIWLEEHLKLCLRQVRVQVAPTTYDAFHRVAIDDWPVEKVCESLGMSPNQVYVAKSRVTRRLQDLMRDLLGEDDQR